MLRRSNSSPIWIKMWRKSIIELKEKIKKIRVFVTIYTTLYYVFRTSHTQSLWQFLQCHMSSCACLSYSILYLLFPFFFIIIIFVYHSHYNMSIIVLPSIFVIMYQYHSVQILSCTHAILCLRMKYNILYYPTLSYTILYYPLLSYTILYYPILSYTQEWNILSYTILPI